MSKDEMYDKLYDFLMGLERDELYEHTIWYNPETGEFEDEQDDGSWYENEKRICLGNVDLSFPEEIEDDYECWEESWEYTVPEELPYLFHYLCKYYNW